MANKINIRHGSTATQVADFAGSNLAIDESAQTLNYLHSDGSTVIPIGGKGWGDTQYLRRDGNLANLANPTTARTNLGLGTAATKDTGTSTGEIPVFASTTLDIGGKRLIDVAAPSSGTDGATKDYVDGLFQSVVSWQEPVLGVYSLAEGGTVNTGDRYIISAPGENQHNNIAEWIGGGSTWSYSVPVEGWAVWDEADDTQKVFNGTDWVRLGSTMQHNNLSGIAGSGDGYHLSSSHHSTLTGGAGSNADSLHRHALASATGKLGLSQLADMTAAGLLGRNEAGAVQEMTPSAVVDMLPAAGAATVGVVTTSAQEFSGKKTLRDGVRVGTDSSSGMVQILNAFETTKVRFVYGGTPESTEAAFVIDWSQNTDFRDNSILNADIDCGTY